MQMTKGEVIVIVLLLISLGTTGFNFYKTFQGQWVYIGELCIEPTEGDEWITDNCRPETWQGTPDILVCNITYEGEFYRAPLSIINISKVEGCRKYSPVTWIYVKTNLEVKQ